MLNPFHLELLRSLNEATVEHLIIGGQARHFFDGTPTADLDIWINHEVVNLGRFADFFQRWKDRYPNHISPMLKCVAERIKPNTQIHIPDADVLFLAGQPPEDTIIDLVESNKADILFQAPPLVFTVAQGRSVCHPRTKSKLICAEDWKATQDLMTHPTENPSESDDE